MKDFDTIYKTLESKYPINDKYVDIKRRKKSILIVILFVLPFAIAPFIYTFMAILGMWGFSNPELFKNPIYMIALFVLDKLELVVTVISYTIGIILAISLKKINPTYKKDYNKDILSTLVKEYNPNLVFTDEQSIQQADYDNAEFEHYHKYTSENCIYGQIDDIININIGNVCTYIPDNDHGDKIDFEGFFSILQLPKNLNCSIKLRIDSLFTNHAPDETLMSMDSSEFEKYFNVYTNNRLVAMQIFTADIMNNFINLRTKDNIVFDFTIKDNLLYTRVYFPPMFWELLQDNSTDYNTLKKYYETLDSTYTLNKMINHIINEKIL